MKKIEKGKLNLSIDIIMFIVLMVMVGIGFLIKYVILPGVKRNEIYGSDVDLYFWGLDRHQWGSIHFIFSLVFLLLLILHIVFHWKMTVCIINSMFPSQKLRIILVSVFVVISIIIGIMPLFLNPDIKPIERRHLYQNKDVLQKGQYHPEIDEPHHSISGNSDEQHESHDIEVFGYMSLNDVAEKYNMPVTDLAALIDVPVGLSGSRLGRIRREYNFQLDDLRDYILLQKDK